MSLTMHTSGGGNWNSLAYTTDTTEGQHGHFNPFERHKHMGQRQRCPPWTLNVVVNVAVRPRHKLQWNTICLQRRLTCSDPLRCWDHTTPSNQTLAFRSDKPPRHTLSPCPSPIFLESAFQGELWMWGLYCKYISDMSIRLVLVLNKSCRDLFVSDGQSGIRMGLSNKHQRALSLNT